MLHFYFIGINVKKNAFGILYHSKDAHIVAVINNYVNLRLDN